MNSAGSLSRRLKDLAAYVAMPFWVFADQQVKGHGAYDGMLGQKSLSA